MKMISFKILCIAVAGSVFSPVWAEDPGPRKWPLAPTPRTLTIPDLNAPPSQPFLAEAKSTKGAKALKGGRPVPKLAGSATVEVVGDAFYERTERLRLFRLELAPSLAQAFDLGSATTTNRQQLSEFMALGGAFRTPSIPSVYYNGFRPTPTDAELRRSGIQVSTRGGKATVTVSAQAGR